MLAIVGGRRRKNKTINKRMKKLKGGCGGCALTPANFNGLDTSAMDVDVNFAKNANMFSSNQIGGGMSYGFASDANGADIKAFGGSYAPMSNSCTGANLNNNRGGNNLIAGGGRGKRRTNKKINQSIGKYKGVTGKYKGRSSSKRSGSSRRSSKRSSSTRKNSMGGKKYRQKGCSNKY
jgi:hypothetical protein